MSDREQRLANALAEIRMLAADLFEDHSKRIEEIADAALAEPEPAPDTRPELTAPQAKILAFIKASITTTGVPPSFREIGDNFGIISLNGVASHLIRLRNKGYVRWIPRKSRTLVLLESTQ